MTRIIYVDVLIAVNIYIGYCLIIFTGTVCRVRTDRARAVLSSVLQGAYSLVILLPELPFFLSLSMKAAACAVFTLTAFAVHSPKGFLRLYFSFLCVSFSFAGVMLCVCTATGTQKMAYRNSSVYFSVDIKILIISTVVCYIISRAVYEIIRLRTPPDSLFTLTVFLHGKEVTADALLDTGNSLTDSFSGLPVIICDIKKISPVLPEGFDINDYSTFYLLPSFRLIPYGTLNAQAAMPAFRPDKITVRSRDSTVTTCDVMVGICDRRIAGGSMGALLNPKITEGRSFTKHDNFKNNKQTV